MPITRRRALTLLSTATAAMALNPSMVLSARQTLVCNWTRDFPPYCMERDGVMTGILVECADEVLGARMGFALDHRGYEWPEAQALVARGQGDILCTNPTRERMGFALFADEPVLEVPPSIFCAADNPRLAEINAVKTLDDLAAFRQVDYKGNGWAAQTFPPTLSITYADPLTQALEMIARGEADVFVGNGLGALYAIRQAGLSDTIHARELPVGKPSSFHFGLRADYPQAQAVMTRLATFQDEAMAQGTIREIILRFL
jgi:polar amino acid transport system substrate-binding protein